MGHAESGHSHAHNHDYTNLGQKRLYIAVFINVLLTIAQFVAGAISGSLSLVADALHNLSDAGAIVLAAFASRISQKPANATMTYGYRRAQILGALINSSSLVIVALYLLYKAWLRFLNPQPIDGWIVVYVASFALVIDALTAFLTYSGAKESINIKAAFIHNVSDALASVVVIVSGVLVILYQTYWVDMVATVLISVYILYHSYFLLKKCVQILMQSVPEEINIESIRSELKNMSHVVDVHHIHVWQLDDHKLFFEGHISIRSGRFSDFEEIKRNIKTSLLNKFDIAHSTLEFELENHCADLT